MVKIVDVLNFIDVTSKQSMIIKVCNNILRTFIA